MRPVELQRSTEGVWSTTAAGSTDSGGAFALPVDTTTAGSSSYRVLAPATALAGEAVSASFTVTVSPVTSPRAVTVSDDLHSLTAQAVTGGPTQTLYTTSGFIDGPVDVTAAGDIAVTEWDMTTNVDDVWVATKDSRSKAYTLRPDRCAEWVKLAPGATTVLLAEGMLKSGRCATDVVLLVRVGTATLVSEVLPTRVYPGRAVAAYSPDGTAVAAAWEAEGSGVVVRSATTGEVGAAQTSPLTQLVGVRGLWWNSRALVAAADDGTGYRMYATTSGSTTPVMSALTGAARAAAVSADGSTLVWQADTPAAPTVRTSAMGYTPTSPVGQAVVANPAASLEPATLTALPAGFVAVTTAEGTKVSDSAANVVWQGAAVAWLP